MHIVSERVPLCLKNRVCGSRPFAGFAPMLTAPVFG
ncbi:hypothetical protein EV687_0707 [Corticibacter populi]|nr:hypothetical protein EV687_0707 [Corticibacter populi]